MKKRSTLFKYRRLKIKFVALALDHYVRKVRKNTSTKVIAVTGTIGKTSAKVAISQLLKNKYTLHIEEQNHNSDRGIRINFFGLDFPDKSRELIRWVPVILKIRKLAKNFPFDVVVIEMAESRHKSLQSFIKEIKPDIGVITSVSPVHMSYFKNLDNVIKATWGLVNLCNEVIYNSDFSELKELAEDQSNATGYSLKSSDVYLSNITRLPSFYYQAKLNIGSKNKVVKTNFIGKQSLYSMLAATAVADKLGWSVEEIAKYVGAIKPVPGRMNLLRGRLDSIIIDDCFNASPIAMKAAIDAFKDFKGYKIAVIGSMNELGAESEKAHKEIGMQIAKVADVLITIGSEAKKYIAPTAKRNGMKKQNVYSFAKSNQLKSTLNKVLKPNSVVLFKGSQGGIYLEEAIKFILADDVDADKVLIRQKNEWLRRKNGYFATTK